MNLTDYKFSSASAVPPVAPDILRNMDNKKKTEAETHRLLSQNLENVPDRALVKVHGFVMLKGLEDGSTYLVKRDDEKKVYWFCTPRSEKKLVGHTMENVNFGLHCFTRGDLNCIQILKIKA